MLTSILFSFPLQLENTLVSMAVEDVDWIFSVVKVTLTQSLYTSTKMH